MNRIELLKTYGIHYNSLPKVQSNLQRFREVGSKIWATILKITVIMPFIQFLLRLLMIRFHGFQLMAKKTTWFGKARLEGVEKGVQELAKRLGVNSTIKVNAFFQNRENAAAAGRSLLFISSEFLIKPSDLPEELNLSHLDNQTMTEDAWILKFTEWKNGKLYSGNVRKPESQLEVDKLFSDAKSFLKRWRNQEECDRVHKSILAHELGHIHHKHQYKLALADFGWDLLALPTLGISTLFNDHVIGRLNRKMEFEADSFGLSKIGPNGLIKFFEEVSEANKTLHKKYPKIYDKKGNNKLDKSHPPLTVRIAKLRERLPKTA